MTKPIDRVYVVQHDYPNPIPHFFTKPEDAHSRTEGMPGSTVRVFVEEQLWTLAPTPGSSRAVFALHRRRDNIKPKIIVAIFGSESKWLALDHDGRLTYLEEGTVLGWREMPTVPEQFR